MQAYFELNGSCMNKPLGGTIDDESAHLCQRALYVEKLPYPFDPDKVPTNGYEYIYKVRLEAEAIFPGQGRFYEAIPAFAIVAPSDEDEEAADEEKVPSLAEWKKKECIFFSKLAGQLKAKRQELMLKFPSRKEFPSSDDEKEICLFCFGSKIYNEIYPSDKVEQALGHTPLLSLVLHISQEDIFIILQYMTAWVMQADFNHVICRWIYALLVCFHKPLSDECEEFLENFYDFIDLRKQDCRENDNYQIHLLSFILGNYFCVKAYSLGPSLDSFISE